MKMPSIFFLVVLLTITSANAEWIEHTLGGGWSNRDEINLADYNMDGDPDILVAGSPAGESEYWQNVGSGSFLYMGQPPDMFWCGSADMDGDGDPDVVGYRDDLFVLEHVGFDLPINHFIGPVDIWRGYVILHDLDSDGDIDIIGGENEIRWWENLGNWEFSEHFIRPVSFEFIDAADMDEDGDVDLLTSDRDAVTIWLENDGSQQFTLHPSPIPADHWVQLQNADIDNDGDLDLVGGFDYPDGGIAWIENFGGMNYSLPHIILPRIQLYSLDVVDFGNDGNLDLISMPWHNGETLLWKNLGDGDFERFSLMEGRGLFDYGDVQGNGLLDIAAIKGSRVQWFEQPPLHALTATLDENGQVHLDWLGGPNNLLEFRVYRNHALIATTTETQFVDQPEAFGSIVYHVVARFVDDPRRAVRAVTVNWPTLSTLNVDHDGLGGIQLSWDTAGQIFGDELDELLEYRIYRNNQFLAATQSTEYNDQLPEMGYYDYRVVALFDDSETQLSEPAGVFWTDTDYLLFEDFDDMFHRTWTVANTSVTNTWNRITDGQVFPTPFLRETAPPGCRLTSPPVDIAGLETVEIQYQWRMWEQYYNGQGDSYYGFGPDGPWYTIAEHEDEGGGTRSHVLTSDQIHGDRLWVSFMARYVHHGPGREDGPSRNNYAKYAIDNISVGPVAADEISASRSGEPVSATALPHSWMVSDSSPNPFNPVTALTVHMPESANLRLTVFNIAGQQVDVLANGRLDAGAHSFTLDGSQLSSGLYFIHAQVPGKLNQTQKVVLMK
jgi:FG-GAP-like repeat/Secretion system C-terminal sorting domain